MESVKEKSSFASSFFTLSLVNKFTGNITMIEFDCNSNNYASILKNGLGNSATLSNDIVTVNLGNGNSSNYEVSPDLTGQVRIDAITVTYITD